MLDVNTEEGQRKKREVTLAHSIRLYLVTADEQNKSAKKGGREREREAQIRAGGARARTGVLEGGGGGHAEHGRRPPAGRTQATRGKKRTQTSLSRLKKKTEEKWRRKEESDRKKR